MPINVGSELLRDPIGDYKPASVIGRGFYGWTLRVADGIQSFAMKIVPTHRLQNKTPHEEPKRLVECAPHPNIANFFTVFSTTLNLLGKQIETTCMVFEFIPSARPLSELVEGTDMLSRIDVVSILAGISHGLTRMHSKGLWHNDLHDDNILIRLVAPDEGLAHRYQPKIIDFGSCRPDNAEVTELGARGDYFYLAKHIYSVTARFESSQLGSLSPADRNFAARLKHLARQVSDPNVSRRALEPAKVSERIQAALAECSTGHHLPTFADMQQAMKASFPDPLDKTNALNLAPQDIALLFTDTLEWESQITKSETVIVVGPRGCGKTMLLRYLSIASQARPQKDETKPEEVSSRLASLRHFGFLVSCAELRTPFLRSSYKNLERVDAVKAEDFCREFISTHFALEVARSVAWLKRECLAPLRDEHMEPLVSALRHLMARDTGKNPTSASLSIEEMIEEIERRSIDLSNLPNPEKYQPTNLCTDDVILRLTRALKSIEFFASKELWFLLDDYSVTVLTAFVQKAYNPVLFRMSNEVRVKVSSEGDGPFLGDTLGRRYKEGRELTKLNLGEIYFLASEDDGRRFFESILQARFKATGIGSLDTLRRVLGEHPDEHSFGKYILRQTRPGLAKFHGFGLLCKLCSGDVSSIIELFRKIVGAKYDSDEKVPVPKQDEETKQFAQRQLQDLRTISGCGPRLYEIAVQIGSALKTFLLNSTPDERIDERLRIEVEGGDELSEEAQRIHDELLRHSVLINGGSGKSRKGLPTQRLYFRRLFAPCFPFSLARRGSIARTVQQYERFLLDPKTLILEKDDAKKEVAEGEDNWESGLGRPRSDD